MKNFLKKSHFNFLFTFILFIVLNGSPGQAHSVDELNGDTDVQVAGKSLHAAAISFFVVDLKYNKEQGVQICEIQPSVISKFAGYDFVNDTKGAAARNFCDYISTLQGNPWFVAGRITDRTFVDVFVKRGWNSAPSNIAIENSKEFAASMSQPVYDPSDIHNFHGLLYTRTSKIVDLQEFLQKFPGVIVIDSATTGYGNGSDKSLMNKFLTDDPVLRKLKPAWNLYPKKYSESLVERIKEEIGSEMFVIKPKRGTLGRGIIIVHKNDLGKAVKKIIKKSKALPKSSDDDAYRYWGRDSSNSFIVEAFAPSDPVSVPHLKGRSYDGTMRVGVVLVYSEGKVDINFVASYWKLPLNSLSEKGSLNEKHKSHGKAPYFAEVSQEVRQEVERQLSETLPHMFEKMIQSNDE